MKLKHVCWVYRKDDERIESVQFQNLFPQGSGKHAIKFMMAFLISLCPLLVDVI